MTTAQGYCVEMTLGDETVTIRATNKIGRLSVFGPDPRSEVTLQLHEIASVNHIPPPKVLLGAANGTLVLRTQEGTRYQLNYRAKKNADFRPLAEAVEEAVKRVQSA